MAEDRKIIDDKIKNRLQELAGIISESKVGNIYDKYYKDVPLDVFYDIIKADPTTPLKDNKPDKLGQYSKWLLALQKKGNLRKEDIPKANEYLKLYHDLKTKNLIPNDFRDVGKIADLPAMYALNAQYGGTGKVKDDEHYLLNDPYFLNTNKAEKFFENRRWLIVIPTTFDASKFYACTSQWCTRFSENYDHYTKDGPLYILIDKTKINHEDATRRYQFHFESHQFMNMNDSPINVGDFFRNNPSLTTAFEKAILAYIAKSRDLNHTTLALLGAIVERDPSAAERFMPALRDRITDGKGNELPETLFETIPGLRTLFVEIYSDNGWTLDEKYLQNLEPERLQNAIEKKMLKGVHGLPQHYFEMADNRLKVYYYKELVNRGNELPESIAKVSDPRLISFYIKEMSAKGKQIPDWAYNAASPEQKQEYRTNLLKNKVHLIAPAQFIELSGPEKKLYIDKYVSNILSFMPDSFFNSMTTELKNYYIQKLIAKKGMDKIKMMLTRNQYNWATTDGFL